LQSSSSKKEGGNNFQRENFTQIIVDETEKLFLLAEKKIEDINDDNTNNEDIKQQQLGTPVGSQSSKKIEVKNIMQDNVTKQIIVNTVEKDSTTTNKNDLGLKMIIKDLKNENVASGVNPITKAEQKQRNKKKGSFEEKLEFSTSSLAMKAKSGGFMASKERNDLKNKSDLRSDKNSSIQVAATSFHNTFIENSLKENTSQVEKYKREQDTMKQQVDETNATNKVQVRKLEHQLVAVGKELKEKGSLLTEALKERDFAIQQSQESSYSLTIKTEELQKQLDSFNRSLQEKILETNIKTVECAKWEKKFEKDSAFHRSHVGDLEAQLSSLQSNLLMSSSQLESVSKEKDIAKKKAKESETAWLTLQEEINELKSLQMKDAKNKNKELNVKNSQVSALERKLNSIESELRDKSFKVDKYKRERDGAKRQLDESINSNNVRMEKLKNHLAVVESNLKEKGSLVNKTLNERDFAIQRSQESSRDLTVKMEDLQKQLDSSNKKLKEKALEIGKLSKKHAVWKKRAEDDTVNHHRRVDDLEKQLSSLQSYLQTSSSQLKLLSKERDSAKKETEELRISNLALQEEFNNKLKSFHQIKETNKKLQFSERNGFVSNNNVHENKSRIEKLKKEVTLKNQELNANKEKLQSFQNQLATITKDDNDFLTLKRQELLEKSKNKRIKELESQVKSMISDAQENTELKEKIRTLEDTIKEGKFPANDEEDDKNERNRWEEVENAKAKISAATRFLIVLYKIILK